jgi:hypothetical protein
VETQFKLTLVEYFIGNNHEKAIYCMFMDDVQTISVEKDCQKRALQKEHRGYITSMFPTKATGICFSQRGHSIQDNIP